jgi:hypothetical protein
MMKRIRILDAVDMVSGHDVTRIIPEEYKVCLLPKVGEERNQERRTSDE